MRYLALLIGLAACGGGKGGASDAGSTDDGALDGALVDTAGPPAQQFVISRERVPANNNEASAFALDLDGNKITDNQLGFVLAVLISHGVPLQPQLDAAVDRGRTLLLAEATLSDATGTFTLLTGENAAPAPCASDQDIVCRHHLDGTGTFDLAATSAHDTPLAGTYDGTKLAAGPGTLHLVVPLGGRDATLPLAGARVRLDAPTADGIAATSVIAGAVLEPDIDPMVVTPLQEGMNAVVARDCPSPASADCGCPSGGAHSILVLFDNNPKDCAVTFTEVRNHVYLDDLLAPDITIDGSRALSFGIQVTAVKATFPR